MLVIYEHLACAVVREHNVWKFTWRGVKSDNQIFLYCKFSITLFAGLRKNQHLRADYFLIYYLLHIISCFIILVSKTSKVP